MPPGIYRLPLELVRKVAAESGSHDLAALALTGRHFHAWVNPCLYEHNIKHEEADAAVWAASHGRLDTLLLLHAAKTRSSKPVVNDVWVGLDRYGPLLASQRPARSPLTFTLLHLAVQGGHDDVVSWLLQQGAHVDSYSENLCGCNFRSRVRCSWTPLHVAICHFQEKTAKLLLAHNSSLQTSEDLKVEALHTAAARGLTSTICHLSTGPGFNPNVKDFMGKTPLHHAIQMPRSLGSIKALLDVGADVQGACDDGSQYHNTPLWCAFSRGALEVAVMLLEAGAKPFAHRDKDRKKVAPYRQQLQRRQRALRMPLLHVTLSEKSKPGNSGRHGVLQRKVVRALLDFGCDINEELITYTEGRTPLIKAVQNSNSATVRLLLERGAEVDANDIGRSALWYALSERASASLTDRVDKVTALLEHGANLLDSDVIMELIVRRSSRAVMDAVADNLGPENLTDSDKIPRVLGLCCIFQERKIYDSIKRCARTHARATDEDIGYVLLQAAGSGRACVPASLDEMRPLLDEMRPGLTVDAMLDQWRDKLPPRLVDWLEEIKGLKSSE